MHNLHAFDKQKFHAVCTIPKSDIKIVEIGKIDTTNTQRHDRSPFGIDTCTSIICGDVRLDLWAQVYTLSEMRQSCNCFSHITG